jgi:diguanylate cyclase (GGDEF)-like protein/PAS domain S-box-containing protein|tara:strand:- start:2617 stop:5139 length:2523 start_codon:yes stop_codon:yes gene_type:complete
MTETKKALIVFDSPEMRQKVRRALTRSLVGHIVAAESGAEAVSFLNADAFDIVITSIELDDFDGWRLTRLIRTDVFPTSSRTPIIGIAHTWCERIAETTAREFGINCLLPVDEVDLLGEHVDTHIKAPDKKECPLSVLVIEDNADQRQLANRVLQERFQVTLARDGLEGLETWRQGQFDLVLLDVMLPELSGEQVLENIMKENPKQSVVMMTAHGGAKLAGGLLLKGAVDYISKPFTPRQLRHVCDIASRREDYIVSNAQFAKRVNDLQASKLAFEKASMAHQHLLDSLQTIVVELDLKGNILFLNQAWQKATGYSVKDTYFQSLSSLVPDTEVEMRDQLNGVIDSFASGDVNQADLEIQLLTKNNEQLWTHLHLSRHMNGIHGQTISGWMHNITAEKHAKLELEYVSIHDKLTGLFNRSYFDIKLKEIANNVREESQTYSLLFIDLDQFKVLNESAGHHHGDIVLQHASQLLSNRLRNTDWLFRLGSDEFAVILSHANTSHAKEIAEDLQKLIEHKLTYTLNNETYEFSCSIGITEINGKTDPPSDYLVQADQALYVAKKRGRHQIHIYNPADTDSIELKENLDWVSRIKAAINDDNMLLYYQPIYQSDSESVEYYEALVRYRQKDGSIVAPGLFLPALESAGEIALLDSWVIRKAIETISVYPQLGRIGINLSAFAFEDEGLLPEITRALEHYHVSPRKVVFELTESASLDNLTVTRTIIEQMHKLGCRFAVDDFGSGFSTFNYLKNLPADYVKVDGAFIKNLANDPVDQALVKSISEIGKALGKKTIAEFVENQQILNMLKTMGINCAQGFYLGRPAPIQDVIREIDARNALTKVSK